MTEDDRLYNLLPSIYRARDTEYNQQLRALLSVIEDEIVRVERDIDRLYENWFIETCDDWLVPYIGDLLGVRNLNPSVPGVFSLRSYVANTLAYRRRKGTLAVVEQLSRDVTGWPSKASEFFRLLSVTQNLNHVRPECKATISLKDANVLELLDGPFETANHTIDIRKMDGIKGKYNIRNVGIYQWPVQSYTITKVRACSKGDKSEVSQNGISYYYYINPMGCEFSMFNPPQADVEITHIAEEYNMPGKLRRRALYDDLEELRQTIVNGKTPDSIYFGDEPVFEVFVNGSVIPPENILICDLKVPMESRWAPPGFKKYSRMLADGTKIETEMPILAAVDPEIGILALFDRSKSLTEQNVQLTYTYGFSSDMGGGPYNRSESVKTVMPDNVDWQVGVSKDTSIHSDCVFSTLGEALEDWKKQASAGRTGVIAIMDNQTYDEHNTPIKVSVPERSRLLIVAAGWPEEDDPLTPGLEKRFNGHVVPEDRRPYLKSDIEVTGTAPEKYSQPGELILNGLLIGGNVRLKNGNLGLLQIDHCTIVPNSGGIIIEPISPGTVKQSLTSINVLSSICGSISAESEADISRVDKVTIEDSIIDCTSETVIDLKNTKTVINRSTILGGVNVRNIQASDSIFTGQVKVAQQQVGCVRYSFMPDGSSTPRRYRCQPDTALEDARRRGNYGSAGLPLEKRQNIINCLKPVFESTTYGEPTYLRLGLACPDEIASGASNRSEMGVFSSLMQPQRKANLRIVLDEYMRFGMESGIFYVRQ